MATFLEMFQKGLQFQSYGVVSELFDFTNEGGERVRMVRFAAAGKTFSLIVDTDEEFAKYKALKGQLVRAAGNVKRVRDSVSISAVISDIVGPGSSGWKDPTASDLLAGLVIVGAVVMKRKSSGMFNGNPWRKCQFITLGDTFEVNHIEQSLYNRIPENALLQVRFGTEIRLSKREDSKIVEMDLVIEDFSPITEDGASSSRPSRERSPAAA